VFAGPYTLPGQRRATARSGGRFSDLFFSVVSMDETAPTSSPASTDLPGVGIWRSIALCVVFYTMIFAASWALGALQPLVLQSKDFSLDAFSAILVPQILAWLVTILLGLQWAKSTYREACPVTRFPLRIVLALLVASFGATILLLDLAVQIPMPEEYVKSMIEARAQSSSLAIFLPLVIVAPIAEEMFFRGLLFRGYLQRYSVTKAVWVSAIVFAVFHLNPWQAIVALPLGLWFAWLVLRTGSIVPGILCHAMVNFSTNFLLVPFSRILGYSDEVWQPGGHFPPLMLSIAAALAVLGGVILWRQLADATTVAIVDAAAVPTSADAAVPFARTNAE